MSENLTQQGPGRRRPKGLSVGCAVLLILAALGISVFGTCLAAIQGDMPQGQVLQTWAILGVTWLVAIGLVWIAVRGARARRTPPDGTGGQAG